MNRSDETRHRTITALDQRAFATSANLAASSAKVYQQHFISLSACHD
ncbi:hypothetical protein [Pseudomonas botevensis]|nr:hypothetical protein [Pseudomonas botevensis]